MATATKTKTKATHTVEGMRTLVSRLRSLYRPRCCERTPQPRRPPFADTANGAHTMWQQHQHRQQHQYAHPYPTRAQAQARTPPAPGPASWPVPMAGTMVTAQHVVDADCGGECGVHDPANNCGSSTDNPFGELRQLLDRMTLATATGTVAGGEKRVENFSTLHSDATKEQHRARHQVTSFYR